jgi:glycosyltransferase involved in cell wall biosynthesis
VLITTPSLHLPGGVANYYRTLRPQLDPDKVYIEVGSRLGENGVLATLGRFVRDCWKFHRTIRDGGFDLVHINPSLVRRAVVRDGLLLLIAAAHRRPVVVFFRGWDSRFAERIRARYLRLFRAVYGKAAAHVVLAESFRDWLQDAGMTQPVFVATTVVDPSFLAGADDGVGNERATSSGCHVLYLSRIDYGKGVVEAIRAFQIAQATCPGMSLTIAGDGPDRKAAEVYARLNGIEGVRFVGHVEGPDKSRLLRQADIFLFPTFYAEGMPNAVLEAMASGLPVVTRAVGGLRDFFRDGLMGHITGSTEPAEFARLLCSLVADPARRRAMGRYNRDYARQHFAAPVVAAHLLGIYEQVGRQTTPR